MRTLLRGHYILGFDHGDHALVNNGEIVYEDDLILHVGRRWGGHVDREIDVGDSLVLPGFIDLDAVADIDHAILDSWAASEAERGLHWSEEYFRHHRRDVFSLDERIFIRECALMQLLLHGVTTCMPIASEAHSHWAESFDEMVGMASVARRLGIRIYLGPSYRSGVNVVRDDGSRDVLWNHREGERGLAEALRFLDYAESDSSDLIHGALLPCRIETLSVELMKATAQLAKSRGVPVRLHCTQGRLELELLQRDYGATPVQLLDQAGLLRRGLLIPHGIYLEESDLDELSSAGVSLIHCPLTSIRYGAVLKSFDRYRASGINIALGSDSHPPDLIRGADIGNNVAKVVEGRLDAGSAADYIRCLTLGGAQALGRTDLGRLAPGAKADLVVVDMTNVRIGVSDDPIRTLLMHGSSRDIRMTVVAGRTVVRDGQIPGLDVEATRLRAQWLFEQMKAAYSDRDYLHRSTPQLFPPSFPAMSEPPL